LAVRESYLVEAVSKVKGGTAEKGRKYEDEDKEKEETK